MIPETEDDRNPLARRQIRSAQTRAGAAAGRGRRLSIALGIPATTSVFTIVNAAPLRPPPFDHADRLAILDITVTATDFGEFLHVQARCFYDRLFPRVRWLILDAPQGEYFIVGIGA